MWVGIGLAILAALIALVVWSRIGSAKVEKMMADKTYALQFVYVEDDGSARELTPDELDYLNTEFGFADGARPYIKSRYRQLTPDGKIGGYLKRRKLPRGTPVAID